MAAPLVQISIPFRPLLAKITTLLQFGDPQYAVFDLDNHSASVSIKCNYNEEEYMYVGGASSDLEESCEQAARIAITDLIGKFDIYIADFTAAEKQTHERCASLWRLKQEEVKRLAKGFPKIPLMEEFVCNEIFHYHSVTLDMVSILAVVTNRLPVRCSSIVTLEQTPSSYTSWLTIEREGVQCNLTQIVGDIALTKNASEQAVARKAIEYLIPIYNIDIIDANYAPEEVKLAVLICECAKNKYVTLKKHILEVHEGLSDIQDEENCATPKDSAHTIPLLKCPPPPPKKQKTSSQVSTAPSHVSTSNKKTPCPTYQNVRSVFYKHSELK